MSDTTTRLRLPFPDGGDGPDGPDVPYWMRRLAVDLDDKVLGYDQGVLSSRPSAGVEGRLYWASDDGCIYYDTGTGWVPFAWQPGDVRLSAANAAPPVGWLAMTGQTLRQSDYPALFAAVSHVYNAGREPSAGMFKLPDMRGRTPVAPDPGFAARVLNSFNLLGQSAGAETHTLTVGEMPRHLHDNTGAGLNVPNYTGGVGDTTRLALTGDGPRIGNGGSLTGWRGDSMPHNNMPPYLILNVWIKT